MEGSVGSKGLRVLRYELAAQKVSVGGGGSVEKGEGFNLVLLASSPFSLSFTHSLDLAAAGQPETEASDY